VNGSKAEAELPSDDVNNEDSRAREDPVKEL
jgi:hypothetical protein